MLAPILKFHLDPIECAHRGSVHVHRNERGQVWVECARCRQRGITYPDKCQGGHTPISLAAASFWAGDYAALDRAYRYQRRTADNPTTIEAIHYWSDKRKNRKRRGSSDEGA